MTTTGLNNDEALRKILSDDRFGFLEDAQVRPLTDDMKAKVARLIGAGLHKSSIECQTSRNSAKAAGSQDSR